MHPSSHARGRQCGAAALVVTLLLLFAMVLMALFANRHLVFEQRSSANQYRSTQAFEAAEAGLEWALAQLNANRRIDAACQPSADPAATSFRGRFLAIAPGTGTITPASWSQAGTATPLQAACVRAGSGWTCSCPAEGLPVLAAPADAAPAFVLQFLPASKPGVVRVAATGCTSLAGACVAGSATRADASATLEAALGMIGGLRTPPAATVTLRGAFDAGTATIGLHNPDPATGIAVDAGGAISAGQARVTTPAGAPKAGALVGQDAALAALAPDRLFAAIFGVDKAHWSSQPAVTRLACATDCSAALVAALAAAADGALFQIDGDLHLVGPLTLGSAQRPVAIVVSGAARMDGAVALTGVLYAGALQWTNTAGAALVRGALISEAGYELFYDRAVLERLQRGAGGFARVNGSWRDF
jgi:hypothetical protein